MRKGRLRRRPRFGYAIVRLLRNVYATASCRGGCINESIYQLNVPEMSYVYSLSRLVMVWREKFEFVCCIHLRDYWLLCLSRVLRGHWVWTFSNVHRGGRPKHHVATSFHDFYSLDGRRVLFHCRLSNRHESLLYSTDESAPLYLYRHCVLLDYAEKQGA